MRRTVPEDSKKTLPKNVENEFFLYNAISIIWTKKFLYFITLKKNFVFCGSGKFKKKIKII